jgi:sugar lactone lactonase YvrE
MPRNISSALFTTTLCLTLYANPATATPLADAYALDSSSGISESPVRVPEGVAFDPVGADFYATSVFGGRITSIEARSGKERVFYREADLGLAFVGVKVAPLRRVVWSCAIDRASTAQAPISYVYAIRVHRAGEGRLIRRFDLPVPFFCNDLALDLQGNVYVTDSYGAALLRIPARALWDASVGAEPFAQSAALAPTVDAGGVHSGMNGTPATSARSRSRETPSACCR